MARSSKQTIDFPFYSYLRFFIQEESKRVYSSFTPLTRKFLNFNNKEKNANAFLRPPQFEALETYVFLKEFCQNKKLWEIFEEWYRRTGIFKGRQFAGVDAGGQRFLFGVAEDGYETTTETFARVFAKIKAIGQEYPNYIFSLTMGLGKTVLMATSIFYEFLLANKYPNDPLYCHNALVFAPDKTVLESLREIITFDKSKVIPPEYLSWLEANLKFFFLDETGTSLNSLDNSEYNIIISNTQKIILKKEHKSKNATQLLFEASNKYKAVSKLSNLAALAGIEEGSEDFELTTNQRFSKLLRLKQLGIYVDEAHHVFGNKLTDDLMSTSKATSLRVTINELAANLAMAGSRVVACYNYTGTPYVNNSLLPEVVYSYGLKDSIEHGYLKRADVRVFDNIRQNTEAFCRLAIQRFWEKCGERRVEGMLPKIAFFASSIDELDRELRPAIENILIDMNISTDKILVNVGDDTLTKNDDLREFKNLDTSGSNKQFILLVNKGKEGWNCRSLFAVALHREPKSKVFVLQATMRCLRQIGDFQHTAMVFLSSENADTLNNELKSNFNVSIDEFGNSKDSSKVAKVKIVPPPVTVKIKRTKKLFRMAPKKIADHVNFKLKEVNVDKYRITESRRNLDDVSVRLGQDKDVTIVKTQQVFSAFSLVAEIAKYLNYSPVLIKKILMASEEGIDKVVEAVNSFNEILYDEIIPRLFKELFDIQEYKQEEEVELNLVKTPEDGYYSVKYKTDELLASLEDPKYRQFWDKSFNVDNYCFDSVPEKDMFWILLNSKKVEKVWFTGMLTHGQTEFIINYIDPVSGGVRSYYPDFLIKKNDGTYLILEVKGDNMIDDETVLAKKEYAMQMATASMMSYDIVKGTEVSQYRI